MPAVELDEGVSVFKRRFCLLEIHCVRPNVSKSLVLMPLELHG